MAREQWKAFLIQNAYKDEGRWGDVYCRHVDRLHDGLDEAPIHILAAPQAVRDYLGCEEDNRFKSMDLLEEAKRVGKGSLFETMEPIHHIRSNYDIYVRGTAVTFSVDVPPPIETPDDLSALEEAVKEEQTEAFRELDCRFPVKESYTLRQKEERQALMVKAAACLVGNRYDVCYCNLCGNILSYKGDPCPVCLAVANGRMFRAYEIFGTLCLEDRLCCGGFIHDRSEMHFHGKYWEGAHRTIVGGELVTQISCEMGVTLKEDRATTYWMCDTDTDTTGMDYGEELFYTDPLFWKKLYPQLERAPEHAYLSDYLSCEVCGNHYYVPNGPCCEEERDE